MPKRKLLRRRSDRSRKLIRPRRAEKPRKQAPPLSPADWIASASDLLMESNVSTVEITNLCKRLGVTKGSFYWHFEGRGDLLSAILDNWRTRMTLDVSARLSRASASAVTTLHRLLGLIRKPRSDRNGAIERSVRDWARIDPVAHSAVIQVDQTRLAYFEGLLRQCDFTEKEARIRAYAAYAMMMGDSILKDTVDIAFPEGEYVDVFVEMILGKKAAKISRDAEDGQRKTKVGG
jgi:AcrR family transcriptional regulator